MSVEELLSRLSNLEVDVPSEPYHVLHLQYPAEDLLPTGATCHLVPPLHMAQRDKPPRDPRLLGMRDFSFYTMISTSSNPEPARCHQGHEKLLGAVGTLSQFPGTSSLKFVNFFDEDDDRQPMICRLRLETCTSNDYKTVKDFELDLAQINALEDHIEEYPWIHLMNHLIHRESDRAWYHVESNMRSTPTSDYEEEWFKKWALDRDADVNWVFRNDVLILHSENDSDEFIDLGTRYGHTVTVYRNGFENMTLEGCISATCQRCGKSILDDYALAGLSARKDSGDAVEFMKENSLWIRLDHDFDDGEFEFGAEDVFTALEMSLRSFSPPRLACPPGFSFGDYRATKAVLENFRHEFADTEDAYEASGETLAKHLFATALDTKIGSSKIPIGHVVRRPRFQEDLQFWIRRAVNLAIASCRKAAEDAVGEASLLRAMGDLSLDGMSAGSIEAMSAGMGIAKEPSCGASR